MEEQQVASDLLTQLGVGGIFVIMLLDRVVAILKAAKAKGQSTINGHGLDQSSRRKIDDLHSWHNITDPATGRRIWYLDSELRAEVSELLKLLRKMVENLEERPCMIGKETD